MIDRLKWILEQMQRLQDDDRVRSEGSSVFSAAKNELVDVIVGYVAPTAAAPAVVTASPEMMAAGLDAINSINSRLNAIAAGVATLMTEASKVVQVVPLDAPAPAAPEVEEQASAPAPAAQ